jgi:hypothetical protein
MDGFDFDGSIIVKVDPRDKHALWVPGPAWELAKEALQRDGRLVVVTGRDHNWGGIMRDFLARRMNSEVSRVEVYTHGPWVGVEHARAFKAKVLKELGVTRYFGDEFHLDGLAARDAGAEFVDVTRLAVGGLASPAGV